MVDGIMLLTSYKEDSFTEQEKEDYLYEYVDAFAEALANLGEH